MKIYLLLLVLLLTSSSLVGQTSIIPIEKSTHEIEIRFYKYASLLGLKNIKILHYKDSLWYGNEYEQINPSKELKTYILIPNKDFESLYASLLKKNINSLPTHKELVSKLDTTTTIKSEAIEKLLSTDGDAYRVEYKIGNNSGRYDFIEPEVYSNVYKQAEEFKDYLAIKAIFEKELKRK